MRAVRAASAIDGSLAAVLGRLEGINAETLERLARNDPDRAVLVRLLETTCLLELSKLTSARLDLASFLQLAADVLCQFLPLDGCAIDVEVDEIGRMRFISGRPPIPATVLTIKELRVDGTVVGQLVVGRLRVELEIEALFEAVATQLSAGVAVVLDAELLRRRAAVETAARLASSLSAESIDEGLGELAQTLAAWPGAMAARITTDRAGLGSLQAVAGYWDDDGQEHRVVTETREQLTAALRFTHDGPHTAASLTSVVDALSASLDRLARTARLVEATETDPLTGLGNRRRLERTLAAALTRAERFAEPLSVLIVDLDHFKHVNDTFGHQLGDEVLMATATAIGNTVRTYDEVARLGGEEFVIVAPATDLAGALHLAERLRVVIPTACQQLLPETWHQYASTGVAAFPEHGTDVASLLASADDALYQAKAAGRNAVRTAVEHRIESSAATLTGTTATNVDGSGPGQARDNSSTLWSRALRRRNR
jgi:diguanylate cyclase (GGDEF)-like protein